MPAARPQRKSVNSEVGFVLTLPRSGSTLLRFMLDSHSMIACPPESQLAALCSNCLSCWLGYRSEADFEARKFAGLSQARAASRRLIKWHLEQSSKSIFCDKSLPNVDLARLLAEIFPQGKFVCLYRHPMDFIVSALDACRWGFSGFGLYQYAATSADNFVFGLARAWCEKTAEMIGMEQALPRRCLRIRYEELVQQPSEVFARLCSFFKVPFEEEAVHRALITSHLIGPGDHKIRMTDAISTSSLGRGSAVPVRMIPPLGLSSLNELAGELGYGQIGLDWNEQPSELRRGLVPPREQATISQHIRTLIESRGKASLRSLHAPITQLRLLIEEFGRPRGFVVDLPALRVREDHDAEEGGTVTVIARLDAIAALEHGVSSMSSLVDRGDIRLGAGSERVASDALRLVGFLLGGKSNDYSGTEGDVFLGPVDPVGGIDDGSLGRSLVRLPD
ncbi:MAG: sulfotransferase family protein [Acidimicrobiales bacterium]